MRPLWLACATLFAFAFTADAESALPFVVINNGLAPPNPANVIDATNSLPNNSLFVRSVGCTDTYPDPPECHFGTAPTSVSIEAGGEVGGDLIVNQLGDGPSWFSSVTLNGGRIGGDVYANNSPNSPGITITGGEVVGSVLAGTAQVLMSGGTVGAIGLDRNVLTMTGGTVLGDVSSHGLISLLGGSILGDLMPFGAYSTTEWHGGTVAGTLQIGDALSTTIFGTDFAIDGIPVPYGPTSILTGLITGTLEDGTPISTQLFRAQDYQDSRLYFAAPVPEPSAAVLIGVGVVALAASRRTR